MIPEGRYMPAKELKKEVIEEVIEEKEELKGEELVTIKLPLTRDKQDDLFVGLNGRTWKIKRGVPVDVPLSVKEIIDNSEQMDELAFERQMKKPKKF